MMNMHLMVAVGLLSAASFAQTLDSATNLVVNGSFDTAALDHFRCNNRGDAGGRFELHTENLSWNKCGKLIAGRQHSETAGNRVVEVVSGSVRIGGGKPDGVPVKPGSFYEYAFDMKAPEPVRAVYVNFNEWVCENGSVKLRRRVLRDMVFAPGDDWRHYVGAYRTSENAVRLEMTMLIWTIIDDTGKWPKYREGDYVLIDNVSIKLNEKYARLRQLMADGHERLRVAPIAVETEPACPFMPVEIADPPTQIVIRAAINEQKPLPVAIANLTKDFAQYRVVLETEPRQIPGSKNWFDNGEPGLEGFPAAKITVREALRFKDTEKAPVTTAYDPLVGLNEASVVSVPAQEAGVVWFDFDTQGVSAGRYCGRLRVIPLGGGAEYKFVNHRYVRVRSDEKIIPVELIVDPIELPREAVRPAHFCSPCQSEQDFNLEADLGVRLYALDTYLFCEEAVGDRGSAFHRTVADYLTWAKRRGVEVKFFIKYDAFEVSQKYFNPKREESQRWPAWERYVRLVERLMREAGVDHSQYYLLVRDEPFNNELEWIREALARLKRICPQMLTYLSVCERIEGKIDYFDCLGEYIDLWSLTSRLYEAPSQVARLREMKAKHGAKLLHYLCSTSVKEPLSAYFRRHCWRGEYWGLDADMLYQFNIYNQGLRGELSFKVIPQGEVSYKADGKFFPSVRYMAYREGVTDIKYMEALRRKRGNEAAVAKFLKDAAKAVVIDDRSSVALPAALRERARQLLLNGNGNF